MRLLIVVIFALIITGGAVWANSAGSASADPSRLNDISSLSIEDLMQIEITTVSKREQRLAKTAAAVYVITRDDIRRSGAAGIPDLLRRVPGVHVSQVNGHQWAISARGFSEVYASNMLVLVDGRNLYTPLFSGVYWDVLDLPLDDIERIEVVRGPGGTSWGANAVNGAINIITRHSSQTQGVLLAGQAAHQDRSSGTVRFGGTLGSKTSYRLYTKHTDAGAFDLETGAASDARLRITQGGFRADTTSSRWGTLALYGTFFGGASREVATPLHPPSSVTYNRQFLGGATLQGEWQTRVGSRIGQTVRAYVDSWDRQGIEDFGVVVMDVEWQQTLQRTDGHALTYGAGFRHADAEYRGGAINRLPAQQHKNWSSAFAESSHEIVPGKLNLTVGSRFEHDSLSGFNMQPSGRLSFTPRRRVELWTAVSRAVRTPSWGERNVNSPVATLPTPIGIPNQIAIVGNERMGSEYLQAYEAGLRVQVRKSMSLDVAAFSNRYSRLQSLGTGAPQFDNPEQPTMLITQLAFFNGMAANSRGLEIAAQWQALPLWKLSASHTTFGITASPDRRSEDRMSMERIYSVPTQQASLVSSVDLPRGVEWTTNWFYSGPRPFLHLESFHRLDSNLLWHATPSIDLGAGARNLTDHRVVQYRSIRAIGITPEIDPGRRLFVQAAFRF